MSNKRLCVFDHNFIPNIGNRPDFKVVPPIRCIEAINALNPPEIIRQAMLKGVRDVEENENPERLKKVKWGCDIDNGIIYMVDYLFFKAVSELPKEFANHPLVKRNIPFGTSSVICCKNAYNNDVVVATIRPSGEKKGCNALGTIGVFNTIDIELAGTEISLYGQMHRDLQRANLYEAFLIQGTYEYDFEFVCINDVPENLQYEFIVKTICKKKTFEQIEYDQRFNPLDHPKEKLIWLNQSRFLYLLDQEVQGATAHLVALAHGLNLDPKIIANLPVQDPNKPYNQNVVKMLENKPKTETQTV